MQFRGSFGRACAALALLAACGAGPLATAPAEASTPSLLWSDARQVGVNCLVQSQTTRDTAALQNALCARVRGLATRGAPFPVRQVEAGDPALIATDTVTLLVHASIERTARGRTVAFTIRPHRVSGGEADILFGTSPRVVETSAAAPIPGLDAALREALAEILPWQRPSGLIARPL